MAEDDINAGGRDPLARNCNADLCASILRGTTDAIFICSRAGRLVLVNPAFALLFEKTEQEILGDRSAALPPPEWAGMVLEQNAAVLADGKTRTFEFILPASAGLRTFLITKGGYCDRSGRMQGVFGIAREITASRIIEQEIIDTSDREKQRLGRELRENFCQHLVGISLLGNVLYEELSRAGLEQARFARQIAGLVKEVVSEVRTLEKGLSVTHIEQGEGLVDALRDLAEQVRSTGEIECLLQTPASKAAVEPQTAMYLFRIAQEAVHNALRHSQARRLLIRLTIKREAVALSVRDDGVGFSENEPSSFDMGGRIGFPIMYYRSRAIGAKLEIKHLRRGGIEVICTVPRRKTARRRPSAASEMRPAAKKRS